MTTTDEVKPLPDHLDMIQVVGATIASCRPDATSCTVDDLAAWFDEPEWAARVGGRLGRVWSSILAGELGPVGLRLAVVQPSGAAPEASPEEVGRELSMVLGAVAMAAETPLRETFIEALGDGREEDLIEGLLQVARKGDVNAALAGILAGVCRAAASALAEGLGQPGE